MGSNADQFTQPGAVGKLRAAVAGVTFAVGKLVGVAVAGGAAIVSPRSGRIALPRGRPVVLDAGVPGFGVSKSSKIPGSRCEREHAEAPKYLISQY